jgi:hypothetical protein
VKVALGLEFVFIIIFVVLLVVCLVGCLRPHLKRIEKSPYDGIRSAVEHDFQITDKRRHQDAARPGWPASDSQCHARWRRWTVHSHERQEKTWETGLSALCIRAARWITVN